MKKDKKEFIKKLADATLPEIINLLPDIIPGSIGLALPYNIYMNYRANEDQEQMQENIAELQNKIKKLEDSQQEIILSKVKEVCYTYLKSNLEDKSSSTDIYTIDYFKIVLRDEHKLYANTCLYDLMEATKENDIYDQMRNAFVLNDDIIINLESHHRKNELEDMLADLEEIINTSCETWDKCAIKEIQFY